MLNYGFVSHDNQLKSDRPWYSVSFTLFVLFVITMPSMSLRFYLTTKPRVMVFLWVPSCVAEEFACSDDIISGTPCEKSQPRSKIGGCHGYAALCYFWSRWVQIRKYTCLIVSSSLSSTDGSGSTRERTGKECSSTMPLVVAKSVDLWVMENACQQASAINIIWQ